MKTKLIHSVRIVLAFAITALSLAGCSLGSYDDAVDQFNNGNSPPPPPPPPPPSGFGPNFSEIQTNVFTPSCTQAGCHSGVAPPAGLNLEAANSYTMLIGIASSQSPGLQRVNSGDPNNSYLIQKLEGTFGIVGVQMPPGNALDPMDISTIRQWISDGAIDDRSQANNPIRVSSLSPAPGAALTAVPTQVVAGFDRDLDTSTVNANTFILEASGNDTTFGDGNEVLITATSISVPGANPRSAVFDLTGVALADDTYRVRLLGAGASVILDLGANALDGEFAGAFPSGDSTAGGDFEAQFTLTTPVVIGPTLDQIQAVVFTPTCAIAGCHSGAAPTGGLNLSDADTSHMALVGVPSSVQAGAIRVVVADPDNSYLIQKLEGALGIAGVQMPPGSAIPQTDIDQIRQWITDGAVR